ncbi:SPOR domain-containing protein, partial [Treponema sp. UBA7567]
SKTVSKKETPAKKVTATAKSVSKTAKSAKTTAQKPVSYWIQVGSYEAKKSADEARTSLENNKIPNEVFTYNDAKGKLFYRVRVGPYTTKSEAEYWQKRIASTNEFAKINSYIVQN